jgi:hypothetical protein
MAGHTSIFLYTVQVLYYLTFGGGLRGWWGLLCEWNTWSESNGRRENFVKIYMPLYTLRVVRTDHVWSCLAMTRLKASHDSISHGAHDPGHLRCYPATGECLYAQGVGIVLICACTAKVLGT